jgi:hypothetical protein
VARDSKKGDSSSQSLLFVKVARPLLKPIAEVMRMKKLMALIMTLMILAAVATPTFAQGRRDRTYTPITNSQAYYNRGYYDYSPYDERGSWDQHRDKLTVALGAIGGDAIRGLIGGGKGAAIGALAGAGGSALYTYKIRDRHYWR